MGAPQHDSQGRDQQPKRNAKNDDIGADEKKRSSQGRNGKDRDYDRMPMAAGCGRYCADASIQGIMPNAENENGMDPSRSMPS